MHPSGTSPQILSSTQVFWLLWRRHFWSRPMWSRPMIFAQSSSHVQWVLSHLGRSLKQPAARRQGGKHEVGHGRTCTGAHGR